MTLILSTKMQRVLNAVITEKKFATHRDRANKIAGNILNERVDSSGTAFGTTAPVSGLVAAAKFAAVRVSPAPTDGVIEIDLAGGCVRVRGIVDAGMLREVLAAAR